MPRNGSKEGCKEEGVSRRADNSETLRKLRIAGEVEGDRVAEGGSNCGGQSEVEGRLSKTTYPSSKFSQSSPRGKCQGYTASGDLPVLIVAVKGWNTQVLLADCPDNPRGQLAIVGLGWTQSGFVFRVTPIWQNSHYSIWHSCQGLGPFSVEICYVLSQEAGVCWASQVGFLLSGLCSQGPWPRMVLKPLP